jgi:hypothetical protein
MVVPTQIQVNEPPARSNDKNAVIPNAPHSGGIPLFALRSRRIMDEPSSHSRQQCATVVRAAPYRWRPAGSFEVELASINIDSATILQKHIVQFP